MAADGRVSVFSVGDVFPDIPDGRASFAPLEPLFAEADIVFGNCEGVYSDRPRQAPSHKHFCGAPRAHGAFLGEVGFDVMTCANNHMIDGGYEGLADTLELLRGQGIADDRRRREHRRGDAPGDPRAGRHPRRVPRLLHRLPGRLRGAPSSDPGWRRCACAPTTAIPTPTSGSRASTRSSRRCPFAADLARYRETIAAAREQADFVIVAPHWGYSSWMEVLQDYELELARDAVEHGADAVMCCHHHSLRGVEIHRGKPIFYGLGTLIHHFTSIKVSAADRAARRARFGERSSFAEDEEFPALPVPRRRAQDRRRRARAGRGRHDRDGLHPRAHARRRQHRAAACR